MLWTLDHLDDLDADFRTFFGISGIGDGIFPDDMTGPRFLALAYRTGAYEGVMAARIARELETDTPRSVASDITEVPSDRAALRAHPAFAGLVD